MTTENNSDDLWGPVSLDNWEEVLCIKNRVATEEDVKTGKAVFYIANDGNNKDHRSLDIQIPALAYQIDEETGEKKLTVMIQAETTNDQEMVGVRYFEGGNGVCSLQELELIQ